MQIHIETRETAIMSIHITRSLSTVLPAVAAALFSHIGSAAAASPQVDFQRQVSEVVAGSIAAHTIAHPEADPASSVRSTADAQQFAQQLLLGWSVSHLRGTRVRKPKLQAKASDSSPGSQEEGDFQSTVRQSLLGEGAASRGAL
jgi:hypothetical protein